MARRVTAKISLGEIDIVPSAAKADFVVTRNVRTKVRTYLRSKSKSRNKTASVFLVIIRYTI